MVKRSSRLAKRNAFKAIEDAIGSSLGQKTAPTQTRPDRNERAKAARPDSQPHPKKEK
jgi:hypothetical protein